MTEQNTLPVRTSFESELQELRGQIDALDQKIFSLLKERSTVVKKVGELKQKEQPGVCPLRPGREARQLRTVVEAFKGSDFLPEAAASMWRMIIMSSLAMEGEIKVSVYSSERQRELYWLAREYFAPFTPYIKQSIPRRVLGDLIDGKAQIGVLPRFEDHDHSGGRWWVDIPGTESNKPRIFATLPFVYGHSPTPKSFTGFAVGIVEPEETGNDLSYLLIETDEMASMHRLQTAFAKVSLEVRWIESTTLIPGKRHHLVEVKGFVRPEGESYRAFADEVGSSLIQTSFLGAVAAPIVLQDRPNPAEGRVHGAFT